MDRLSRHERIIDTEYYLYGGVVDVPKIYDADSKHHGERFVKGIQVGGRPSEMQSASEMAQVLTPQEEDWLRRLIADA